LLDIHTPDESKPQRGFDFNQVAIPMVHPTTGETISSYKKLMYDPATSKIWQMAFGKDFGGMALLKSWGTHMTRSPHYHVLG
jgi:hypothetical protein